MSKLSKISDFKVFAEKGFKGDDVDIVRSGYGHIINID